MRSWIHTLRKRTSGKPPRKDTHTAVDKEIELLVTQGLDSGQRFTVDFNETFIGRRPFHQHAGSAIYLTDPTVSARQAVIRRKNNHYHLSHLDSAKNLTLVDNKPAADTMLDEGATIRIGHVLLLVTASGDFTTTKTLGVTSQPFDAVSMGPDPLKEMTTLPGISADKLLGSGESAHKHAETGARLIVERGLEALGIDAIPLASRDMLIGRGENCAIQLADPEVSREHAELRHANGSYTLIHRSNKKSTLRNGVRVRDQVILNDGDVLTFADRVILRVELSTADAAPPSIHQVLEEKARIDQTVEEQYQVEGSFLDIDVVDSFGMKAGATSPESIIISFERLRAYVKEIVMVHNGQILNSNGDELMCYFAAALDAVSAGNAILEGLDAFNARENLLAFPFRVRIGIHTGKSLVDFDRGIAYSEVLDGAGHLQKCAPSNDLLVSQATREALPDHLPFARAGVLERSHIIYFRQTRDGDGPKPSA